MFQITASGPTRIDLAGGTLDIWPIHHLIPKKATVNIAIDLKSNINITPTKNSHFSIDSRDLGIKVEGDYDKIITDKTLPLLSLILKALWRKDLPSLEIKTEARSPKGAGIGGSSSLALIAYAGIRQARQLYDPLEQIDEQNLINTVRDLEAKLIKTPTGCQDYWPCLRGGINIINYDFGLTKVDTLDTKAFQELKKWMLLYYSGKSRDSATNNWEVYKHFFNQDKKTIQTFTKIGELALACAQALKQYQIKKALTFSKQEWLIRKTLWPQIETKETKRIDNIATSNGAFFTRVCGAGGGGIMSLFAPPEKHHTITQALKNEAGTILTSTPTNDKLTVVSKKT